MKQSDTKESTPSTPSTPEPKQEPKQEFPVVVLPADVFSQAIAILSTLPYKDVGALMNTLANYPARMASKDG